METLETSDRELVEQLRSGSAQALALHLTHHPSKAVRTSDRDCGR